MKGPDGWSILGSLALATLGLTFAMAMWFLPDSGLVSVETSFIVGIAGGTCACVSLAVRDSGALSYFSATAAAVFFSFGGLVIGLLTEPTFGGAYFVGAGSAFMLCELAVRADRWARSRTRRKR
jgi:hypothetical protein